RGRVRRARVREESDRLGPDDGGGGAGTDLGAGTDPGAEAACRRAGARAAQVLAHVQPAAPGVDVRAARRGDPDPGAFHADRSPQPALGQIEADRAHAEALAEVEAHDVAGVMLLRFGSLE